jgi:hypothetical protein
MSKLSYLGKKSNRRRRFTKVAAFVAYKFGNCKCFAKINRGYAQLTETPPVDN